MSIRHSYEDLAAATAAPTGYDVIEAFSGTSIVRWYDTVKYKLQRMIEEQEANRNYEYAALIRTFLNTWQENKITGSINRETLEILKAAAEPLTVMNWAPASYFQGLGTSLSELIADQEQLPTDVPTDQNAGFAGGAGFSAPPMSTDFGPEGEMQDQEPKPGEEEPSLEPEPGLPGEPGAPAPEDEIPTR